MESHNIILNSLSETDRVARFVAKFLFPGAVILLWGNMGSGKTTFTKSICAALKVNPEKVTSPTYTLVNIYNGNYPIFHVDLYRLNSNKELDDFDRQDLITDEGITIVEWPKFMSIFLTDEPVLNLNFETYSKRRRQLKLESHSSEFDTLFRTLKQQNSTFNYLANSSKIFSQ